MDAKLEQDLLDRFGKFLNLRRDMNYHGQYFRCVNGWYIILYLFFQELEKLNADVKFGTVKEKWGWLRTYPDFQYCVGHRHSKTDMLHPDVLAAIHALEWKSYETCEFCGDIGVIRWDYEWMRTLCDTCLQTYDSPPRKWPNEIRRQLTPHADLTKLSGYNRVG